LPAIGVPGTGGRGQILGGSTEASTVDIAKEFTNLIVYQRGYQANTRVITTADEISQETINLKR
jgi:flagellar hook protein FlgE